MFWDNAFPPMVIVLIKNPVGFIKSKLVDLAPILIAKTSVCSSGASPRMPRTAM